MSQIENNSDNDSNSIDEELHNIFTTNENIYSSIESNQDEYITNCQCYSLPMFYDYEKIKKLENSDKILIPMHIINRIKDKFDNIVYPLIFEIEKIDNEGLNFMEGIGMKKIIKCQVYDFLEDIDDIYIPFRLMQNLWMNEGSLISLKYSLKQHNKGTKIILRPHTSEFLDIDEPKVFLKNGLIENYSILSKEDIISISYLENTLYFDVLETFPENTIIVNNTDLEVDFENPLDYTDLDYKEIKIPEKKIEQSIDKKNHGISQDIDGVNKEYSPFSGKGYRLGDK